uniref:Uncharacterized protein n=1 Tax=Plectus sambesii TaxID=2011161 RepID=A0A914WHV0_9BILA
MTVEELTQNDTSSNHWEDTIVGVSYSLSAIVCFIPYVVVLKAITTDKELMKLTSYRIIVHMGIRDILQLIVHFITGPLTICQSTLHMYVNKVLGATATSSYVPYALMTLLLAFNRLVQLCFTSCVDTLFNYKITTLWLMGCHGIGVTFFVFLASPWAGMIYFPDWYSWDYDSEASLSWLVQGVEEWIEVSVIIVSGI